jgi:uncharacterized membrane protein YhaH (DUF805 family)
MEYWIFTLSNFVISFFIGIMWIVIPWFGVVAIIYTLAVFLPLLAVNIRRLHDTGRSGWWCLVPVVGFIFMLLKGDSGKNDYGYKPKDEDEVGWAD